MPNLPQIGRAGSTFARTISAPAMQPIQTTMSTLRNPVASMDLPPIMSALGGLAQDAAGGMLGTRRKKPEEALSDIEVNTNETNDTISDNIPTMIKILSDIEDNTRPQSAFDLEETKAELMKPKQPKITKKTAGEGGEGGKAATEMSLWEWIKVFFKFSLATWISGKLMGFKKTILTGITGMFGKEGIFGRIGAFFKPSNLRSLFGFKAIRAGFLGGMTKLAGKFLTLILLPFQMLEGFLREITNPDSEDSLGKKFLKGLSTGFFEMFDFVTFGLFDKDKIIEWSNGMIDYLWDGIGTWVGKTMADLGKWWKEFDFNALMAELPGMIKIAVDKLGELWDSMVESLKKSIKEYFLGDGIGFTRTLEAFSNIASYFGPDNQRKMDNNKTADAMEDPLTSAKEGAAAFGKWWDGDNMFRQFYNATNGSSDPKTSAEYEVRDTGVRVPEQFRIDPYTYRDPTGGPVDGRPRGPVTTEDIMNFQYVGDTTTYLTQQGAAEVPNHAAPTIFGSWDTPYGGR